MSHSIKVLVFLRITYMIYAIDSSQRNCMLMSTMNFHIQRSPYVLAVLPLLLHASQKRLCPRLIASLRAQVTRHRKTVFGSNLKQATSNKAITNLSPSLTITKLKLHNPFFHIVALVYDGKRESF